MYRIILSGLIGAMPFVSHALVVDKLECNLRIQEVNSDKFAETRQEVALARLPARSTRKGVKLTTASSTGHLELSGPGGHYFADLNIESRHATLSDTAGRPVEARQYICLSTPAGFCEDRVSENGGKGKCLAISKHCHVANDPFDPSRPPQLDWTPVPLVGGIPGFARELIPSTVGRIFNERREEVATFSASCQFEGTYR